MKTTNRLISLFAAMLFATTMLADVVYEPLIVDSGFNRDVIREKGEAAVSALYSLGTSNTPYSCFATDSVIYAREKYTYTGTKDTDAENLARLTRSGWPSNFRDTIRCTADGDAKDSVLYQDVFWMLNPYDTENALCIRPNNDAGGYGNTQKGTLRFKKIGCYDRLFFLIVSLRTKKCSDREVTTKIYYSDTTSSDTTFIIKEGLGGVPGHRVRMTNVLETGGNYIKNIINGNLAFACVYDIEIPQSKLIDSISFENTVDNSSVTIFGVTGRTADIDAPDEESTEVNNVDKTSFQACWDAIAEAASYRIDVATDPDFQNILAEYNNRVISGESTCEEVVDLVSNHDYYWRVRSVNEAGGQSASSAPRRVKTAADPDKGETPPETSETSEDIESMLEGYAGYRAVVPSLKIHRTLCRNGYFNTLCLPFSLNAEQIAASPLAGIRVFEYVSAEKHDGLDIVINGPIDHIDAGVPYLVNWEPTSPEWIGEDGLVFENVNILKYKGDTIGDNEHVQFIGNIGIATLVELDVNNLFLGANNTLYYPEGNNRLRGFRSYFKIPSTGAQAVARHTPARIVTRKETPTGVESIQSSAVSVQKIVKDGQVIILRDGKRYNVLGIEL